MPPGINPMQAMKHPQGLGPEQAAWRLGRRDDARTLRRGSRERHPVQAGSQAQPKVVSAVYLLDLRKAKDSLSKTDPVIGQLDHITMGIPGILTKKPDAQITFEPLITRPATRSPWTSRSSSSCPTPKKILADFKSEDKPLTLAARITGKSRAPSPTATRPSPRRRRKARPPTARSQPLAESTGTAEIIVVADCDMLSDRFWVQEQRFGNSSWATRSGRQRRLRDPAADNLGGSSDLISLQRPGQVPAALDRVERIQATPRTTS